MSNVFGGGGQKAAQAQAAQQAADARVQTREANEGTMRNQQQGERGSGSRYGRGARALLTGNLSSAAQLKSKMGA